MARSEKNLTAVFTDTASAIRAKTGTTEEICPLDFADKINEIPSADPSGLIEDFKNHLTYYNFTGTEIKGLSNADYTSTLTNMEQFFYNAERIITIPQIDLSSVVRTVYMFAGCNSLKSLPPLEMPKAAYSEYMFQGCQNLTTIQKLYMPSLRRGPYMFWYCQKLTNIQDLGNPTIESANGMFGKCPSLEEVPPMDVHEVTYFGNTFDECTSLKAIHMRGMKASFDISASTLFTREALVEILNNLGTITSTETLTMGATNLAKLTDEDKAIATNKGWTLA